MPINNKNGLSNTAASQSREIELKSGVFELFLWPHWGKVGAFKLRAKARQPKTLERFFIFANR